MNIRLLVFISFLLCSCSPPHPAAVTISGQTMGTTYSVKINNRLKHPEQLKTEIDKELFRINALMSTYEKESEISRFNRWSSTEWFQFSADTIKVLLASQDIAEKSKGAFDITIAPLVNLWGFGPDGKIDTEPPAKLINETKRITGFQQLIIDGQKMRARKLHPDLSIDLSAIAKGFGVDKIAELLAQKGLSNYMVEIGGEILAKGVRPEGTPWQIALEKPVAGGRIISTIIGVSEQAIATSGSYRNYFENNGVRYSHTIDPQSGRPISHKLLSVSVAHESCMMADAWATVLMVLGAEQGKRLAEQHEIKAFFMVKDPTGFGFKQEESSLWNLSSP